ncbi:MAG: type II toxin-antitoxin system mRNA interferase toxin, RelE/StbE family [Nitrospirae bacterium]|nr:type II toxin-antitoxin system mRNA interferase toxin, RelE/StbE family [Nitrospirota bacterium]
MMTIRTAALFERQSKKLLKKNPELEKLYISVIEKLISDPFEPTLHTHFLTGKLKGKYACSLTHKLRLVFTLSGDIIHLLNIGSHDDIY